MELNVNVLDIWIFDDEEGEGIDLWRDDKGKAQSVTNVKKKNEEAKPKVTDKGKAKSEEEEKKVEEVKEVKRDEKTLSSVWELLMNSKPIGKH